MKHASAYLRVNLAISQLYQGGRLIRMHTSNGREWLIPPSGDRVKSRDAIKIIERSDIRSMDDGFLPGCGQTWTVGGST